MTRRLTKAEQQARSVPCETCGAAAGKGCVYIDGAFKGTTKLSGAHGGRLVAAIDAAGEAEARHA